MKWMSEFKNRLKATVFRGYKQVIVLGIFAIQLIGTPVYAAAFTPPQAVLDGVQWVVLASQFATICYAAWQLGPIGWAFMRKNQQKVEEGKDHAGHVAIGIAIVFVGLWVLKTYIETLGGTYPLPF